MKFASLVVVAALVVSGSLCAQTIQLNSAADWQPNKALSVKDGVITAKGILLLTAKKSITIDPAKAYYFSLETRSTGNEPAWNLFGVRCYDAKGREISCVTSNAFKGTDTALAADMKKGDKTLTLKDASKWPAKGRFYLITGVKDNYADIPNFNYEYVNIVKKEKKADCWVITLDVPLRKQTGKAGEKVRLHRPGGYYYVGGNSNKVGKDWVSFKGVSIKGMAPAGTFGYNGWPTGTVKVTPIILSNWSRKKVDCQYRNITVTVK